MHLIGGESGSFFDRSRRGKGDRYYELANNIDYRAQHASCDLAAERISSALDAGRNHCAFAARLQPAQRRLQPAVGRRLRLRDLEYSESGGPALRTQPPRIDLRRNDGSACGVA